MDNQPILSICIPIYNRKTYLEIMLARFLEDKHLFQNQIQLYISDNCSTEDVYAVAQHYADLGLNLTYHCNESNLGMDGNFINCFNHAKGKYAWLLGSDDIPVKGFLQDLLNILVRNDYGLLHIKNQYLNDSIQLINYDDGNTLLEDIYVGITFISGNIVKKEKMSGVNLENYKGTLISQVPLYIFSALTSNQNAIYYHPSFENGNDSKNNGGYNLFNLFVKDLYSIFQEFVNKGLLKKRSLEIIKRRSYKNWLVGLVVDFLIIGHERKKNFSLTDSWKILKAAYGCYPYFYFYTVKKLVKEMTKEIFKMLLKSKQ